MLGDYFRYPKTGGGGGGGVHFKSKLLEIGKIFFHFELYVNNI